jgi:cell division protein FtsI/penicillin-binding protein 2
MKNEPFFRFTMVGIILSLFSIGLVFKVVVIQFNEQYTQLSTDLIQSRETVVKNIYPERGNIYDRWGHLLATNDLVYRLGINLQEVGNPVTIASVLASEVDMDYNQVFAKASTKYEAGKSMYIDLKKAISPETWERIQKIRVDLESQNQGRKDEVVPSLAGLEGIPGLQRSYPEKTIAANVIGFYTYLDNDGERNLGRGYYGVEEYYNDLLAGRPVSVRISIDPSRLQKITEPKPGASLVLTIDREIQRMAEEEVDNAVASNNADSGTILIMDPKTGEILAMATTPRLDPNEYWDVQKTFPGETPYNRAVSQNFEPGSVSKVLTMAAGFDSGVVDENTVFLETGIIEVGGVNIYNWDRIGHGQVTMQDCLGKSLNVCLAWVATQMGNPAFYGYMQRFQLGERTNIDLAGESFFPMRLPGDPGWSQIDLGTNSFGQGYSSTPVQFITAVASLANNGMLMAPHVTKEIIDGGKQNVRQPQPLGEVIKPEVARKLTEILANSLEEEASTALVDGYRLAGKTGTAEIAVPGLGYATDLTNASFIGWGPVDDPQFVVYVWLEKPRTSRWGSIVAAPVFRTVVEKLVILMNIPPDDIRRNLEN